MNTSQILQPGEGDILSLPPPFAAQVTIKSGAASQTFAVGLLTLSPRAALPSHRFLHYDFAVVVLKGQGRATVGQQTATVVPGVSVTVPRQTWHSLGNTGTGALQVVWTASSPEILSFFRELAHAPDAAAAHAVAQRHGVELGGAPAQGRAPSGRHRRHHRHGGARQRPAQTPSGAAPPPPPPVAAPPAGQPAARITGAPGARPSRHGRRGGRPLPGARGGAPRSGRDRPRRAGRVKEVYMGGRWVRVEGEGPVIAAGEEHARRQKRPKSDGDAPAGPLSVMP